MKKENGLMIIISSPSGCGKTTIVRALLECGELNLHNSISATTRLPRNEEKHEIDYYFLSENEFEAKINENYFLEYAKVFGRYYGTPKNAVEKELKNGKDVIFDIDWQGAIQLNNQSPQNTVTIFILPPSLKELHDRLKKRDASNLSDVSNRMNKAKDEISQYHHYEYVIINDDLNHSIQKVKSIIIAEKNKRIRQKNLDTFVMNLLNESF
jgi:guanylate kinase